LPPLIADPLSQTPNIYNDGTKMVQDVNLILAELSHPGGENYPLLITKEVFRVEKVRPEDRSPVPMNPFDWPVSIVDNIVTLGPFGDNFDEYDPPEYEAIVKNSGFLTRIPKQ